MTIIQLQYLIEVANCGSFSAASEHCFVTQPSLSMQVKALEEELGVVLLDRSKKPVIPTEAGAIVIAQAQETLKAYNTIRESVAELKGETAGKLRLGVIPTIAPYLLHKFIPDFVKSYPRVELEIREMVTADIVDSLHRDKIDVALVASGTCGDGIIERDLFSDHFYAYVSPSNPLYERSNIRIEDIDLKDLILLSQGNCMRDQIIELDNLVTHAVTLTQQNQVFQVDILDADIRTFVEWIRWRHIGVEVVAEEVSLDDSIAASTACNQRHVDFVTMQRIDDVGRHHLSDFQLNTWVALHKVGDKLVEQVGGDGWDNAQAKLTCGLAFEFGYRLADGVVGLECLLCLSYHDGAGFGGDYRFFRAVEQHYAQLLLKSLDLHRK